MSVDLTRREQIVVSVRSLLSNYFDELCTIVCQIFISLQKLAIVPERGDSAVIG